MRQLQGSLNVCSHLEFLTVASWQDLTFRTIDLGRHADVAVEFRRDAYRIVTGSNQRFDESIGAKAYLKWLENRIRRSPLGQVHVWAGDEVIGQIEARQQRNAPKCGLVNLYYLAPAWRGRGLGRALEAYTSAYFENLGVTNLSLNVRETNLRAYQFYSRQGWHHCGPTPDVDGHIRMERYLYGATSEVSTNYLDSQTHSLIQSCPIEPLPDGRLV